MPLLSPVDPAAALLSCLLSPLTAATYSILLDSLLNQQSGDMKGAERPPIWLVLEHRRGHLTPVEDLYWANKENGVGDAEFAG